MTTIAFDGKTLAVDSRVTQGNVIVGGQNKTFTLDDGSVCAFAGTMSLAYEAYKWLNSGADKDEIPDVGDGDGLLGILIKPDGSCWEVTIGFVVYPAIVPWAGGSGMSFALSAMALGKDAVAAVEFAGGMDIYSGGPVTAIAVEDIVSSGRAIAERAALQKAEKKLRKQQKKEEQEAADKNKTTKADT